MEGHTVLYEWVKPVENSRQRATLGEAVMKRKRTLVCCGAVLVMSAPSWAHSVFDGTWRPEYPQKVAPGEKHDVIDLKGGVFECRSCTPPYTVAADGVDHPASNNPGYDARNIKVVDARTVVRTAKKGGRIVYESRVIASEDGRTLTELQTIMGETAHPVVVRIRSTRIGAATPGSHAVSGEWQRLDYDLPNNDEDTTLHVEGDTLSMSDKMGRSFSARLDGSDAPYSGSPEFTSVSVKQLDARTLEERDKRDGKVVKITRWAVDPDGTTIHARFDDTHGRIQEQAGHKLP